MRPASRACGRAAPWRARIHPGLAVVATRHLLEDARLAASLLEIVELASGVTEAELRAATEATVV